MSGIWAALYTIVIFAGVFLLAWGAALTSVGGWGYAVLAVLGAGIAGGTFWRLIRFRVKNPVTESELRRARKRGRPVFSAGFAMLSGLELPAGARCRLAYTPDGLELAAPDRTYTLPHSRVTAAAVATVRDAQRQYVSSAGGAVAGGLLLGPLGALLGGMARQRTVRSGTKLLLLAYIPRSGDGERYLVLRPRPWSLGAARRFAAACRKNAGGRPAVEL